MHYIELLMCHFLGHLQLLSSCSFLLHLLSFSLYLSPVTPCCRLGLFMVCKCSSPPPPSVSRSLSLPGGLRGLPEALSLSMRASLPLSLSYTNTHTHSRTHTQTHIQTNSCSHVHSGKKSRISSHRPHAPLSPPCSVSTHTTSLSRYLAMLVSLTRSISFFFSLSLPAHEPHPRKGREEGGPCL